MKSMIRFIILSLGLVLFSLSSDGEVKTEPINGASSARIDTFEFLVNGSSTKGKIYLPATYETNKNLPAIYLIDFTEQQFKIATDEFEKVIAGVESIQGFDALVVTLDDHLDVDSKPGEFQKYYEIFRNITLYVDANYTHNTSRTFIGKGSEGGIVLMTLFLESPESSVFENFIVSDSPGSFNPTVMQMIEKDDFPKIKQNKKLHLSFSTSNNRDECIRLINMINEAQYTWLQFESLEYANSDYENTYPDSFAAGIKYIFDR